MSVFDSREVDSPCYRCLYEEGSEPQETCSENGVLAPIVGIIGAIQALEALKLVLSIGSGLSGRLLLFDGLTQQWRTLKLRRDPTCPVCG